MCDASPRCPLGTNAANFSATLPRYQALDLLAVFAGAGTLGPDFGFVSARGLLLRPTNEVQSLLDGHRATRRSLIGADSEYLDHDYSATVSAASRP